ncbi:FUSC family protein [Zunongwangia endophytica]|uniref:FUSC family protein n=1 Tax=Zunongwangia endophytica TaxID=1808945 RepID=A0ABV8H486_9FLAO|nr:FUSC family protein [Zunongwangia endophytica]MDN3595634.1 FUSC family protein [Zunongwangia endophytica]
MKPPLNYKISSSEGIYLLKCIIGTIVCFALFDAFPQYPFYWSIISCLLVFSQENDRELALNRIKSNFLGSFVGLAVYFLPIPSVVMFCLGVAFTIVLGIVLKIEPTIRSALAAVIIVIINEDKADTAWVVGLQRAGCVLLGCLIALFISMSFNRLSKALFNRSV